MLVRLEQPENALSLIFITELGKVMLDKPVQPLNASLPIFFTEFERLTLVRPEHPLNAKSSMLITEFGMVTLVRPEQFWNAYLPILATFPVIDKSFISLPTSSVKIIGLPITEFIKLTTELLQKVG